MYNSKWVGIASRSIALPCHLNLFGNQSQSSSVSLHVPIFISIVICVHFTLLIMVKFMFVLSLIIFFMLTVLKHVHLPLSRLLICIWDIYEINPDLQLFKNNKCIRCFTHFIVMSTDNDLL